MNFPVLKTERLLLSQMSQQDANDLFQHFSDPETVTYYDLEPMQKLDSAIRLIELFDDRYQSETGIRWSVRERESGEFVGTCGFNSWNGKMKSGVIGYDISRAYWGKGFATEAVRGIIECAYGGELPCEMNRIQGDVVPGNVASEAVLRKLGFKEEGLLRESGFWKGKFHDLKCFGLIRSDYDQQRNSY